MRWAVKQIVYRLGSRLPSAWATQDVGSSQLAGAASVVGETFVVAGDGSDIWGRADGFRFAYQELPGPGSVSARVVTRQKVYPGASWASAPLNEFAKSGVMIRESIAPDAASVVLDVKPGGELEFMARYATGEQTAYLGGATTPGQAVWLALSRGAGSGIAAAYSVDGLTWTVVGALSLNVQRTTLLAGLAVTSHEPSVLNGSLFDHVAVIGEPTSQSLLARGDFEDYQPPALGTPGWVSDDALRQSPAKSETHQPRTGQKNGACWTPAYLDCGMYQEIIAPASAAYILRIYASADRNGGLVGANVNGMPAASTDIQSRPFGDYVAYSMTFSATAGDLIRVWMYSPGVPGYVVIDDATLTVAPN